MSHAPTPHRPAADAARRLAMVGWSRLVNARLGGSLDKKLVVRVVALSAAGPRCRARVCGCLRVHDAAAVVTRPDAVAEEAPSARSLHDAVYAVTAVAVRFFLDR